MQRFFWVSPFYLLMVLILVVGCSSASDEPEPMDVFEDVVDPQSPDVQGVDVGDGHMETDGQVTQSQTQVHVTVAAHLEPSSSYQKCGPKDYDVIRKAVVDFVRAVVERGAALNLQSDDTFWDGMAKCEGKADKSNTDGLSLGAWLSAQPNVEVDAHKEGGNEESPDGSGPDNTLYADVHALASAVVDSPSNVVGGFIWENTEQVARLLDPSGLSGVLEDTPIWIPEILSMAVGQTHHDGDFEQDDFSSGVWRPAGAGESFFEFAESGPPYVGTGLQHSDWSGNCRWGFRSAADYSAALLSLVDEGSVPAGFYTATIAVPQSAVKAEPADPAGRFQMALGFIDDVNSLRATDSRVSWSTYTQVVEQWTQEAGGISQRLDFGEIPAGKYSCK